MKQTINNRKGFTLIELLVVIAIIAILSTIGLTLFNGAQNNARDARRKSDIDAIAAALEGKRAPGTAYYTVISGSDFSSGNIPTDTTAAKYCIKTYNTVDGAKNEAFPSAVAPITTWGTAATDICPTVPALATVAAGYGFLQAITSTDGTAGFDSTAGKEFPATTVMSWKICARLEASTDATTNLKVYCKSSAQ